MGFFNDLGKKATETYKNTTDKTNKIAREMKLKSYINENKNRIEEVYTEIGKKVYEKFNEGNISDIESFVKPEIERIEEYARKIENMNNEIRSINNIKLCTKCAAEIDLNARFCSKCGAEQKVEVTQEEKQEENNNTIETVINAEPVYPVEEVKENVEVVENVDGNEEKNSEENNQASTESSNE